MTTTPLSRTGRKTRYDKGQVMLTERDLHVLRWIAQQYTARFDQVQDLLGKEAGSHAETPGEIGESATRQVIARWRRAGWIVCRKVFAHESPWLHVTASGLRELGLSYKPNTPSAARLHHLFAVNEVRLTLAAYRPGDSWLSERTFRSQLRPEKWESQPHLPDGILITEQGNVAIEAELTPKGTNDLYDIVDELARTYPAVWYFAAPQVRRGVLAARAKLPDHLSEVVQVFRYSDSTGIDESEAWAQEPEQEA